jgi:hypothetical protein
VADSPYDKVRAVYTVLKTQMQERFSPDHYVAIAGGKIVGDSDSLDILREKVLELKLKEADVMFDQVGYDALEFREYPGWFLAEAAVDYWVACLLPTAASEQ